MTRDECIEGMESRGWSKRLQERVLRLNRFPRSCGYELRGVHQKKTISYYTIVCDCVSVKGFIEMFGRDKYRALPREAFIRKGHRKFITHHWLVQNKP